MNNYCNLHLQRTIKFLVKYIYIYNKIIYIYIPSASVLATEVAVNYSPLFQLLLVVWNGKELLPILLAIYPPSSC